MAPRSSDPCVAASAVRRELLAEPEASASASALLPWSAHTPLAQQRRLGGGVVTAPATSGSRGRCWVKGYCPESSASMLASASRIASLQRGSARAPARAGVAPPPRRPPHLAWTASGGTPISFAASAKCRPRSPATARSYMPALSAIARHLRLLTPVAPGQAVSKRPRRVAAALGHNKQRYWPTESGANGTCSRYTASEPQRASRTGPSSAARVGGSRAGRRRSTIALAQAAT